MSARDLKCPTEGAPECGSFRNRNGRAHVGSEVEVAYSRTGGYRGGNALLHLPVLPPAYLKPNRVKLLHKKDIPYACISARSGKHYPSF